MCYVKLPTTCADKKQSGSDPDKWVSHEACLELGNGMISGIVDTVQGVASNVGNTVQGVASNVGNAITNGLNAWG